MGIKNSPKITFFRTKTKWDGNIAYNTAINVIKIIKNNLASRTQTKTGSSLF